MSLYYEAAVVLANPDKGGGSLKSRVYKYKDLKSSPAQIFALVTEASKWSFVLKEVIKKSGLLAAEKKLTPVLALLLSHDLLVSKNGVAAPANHVLRLAVARHKARLNAEFTKVRIQQGHATLEAFRHAVNQGSLDSGDGTSTAPQHPRWVRINTLKTTVAEQLASTFAEYKEADTLQNVVSGPVSGKKYHIDTNIPNLLALPPKTDLSRSSAYTSGQIIFQDKASCFPAYLLDVEAGDGDIIDGCAAPGNKTTHLAAIVAGRKPDKSRIPKASPKRIIAFERDKIRAKTLEKMVKFASADYLVSIRSGHNFLLAKPESEEFANVGAVVLDPSCSGSGIVGRDDTIKIYLPDPSPEAKSTPEARRGKKRKREDKETHASQTSTALKFELEDANLEERPVDDTPAERLAALSTFQLQILLHAMRFPRARKITYSTCSTHFEENERVVFQALASRVAQDNGWKILKREQQVEGLKKWTKRGIWEDGKVDEGNEGYLPAEKRKDILEACIRCEKGSEDGTMGFFVAAFVRQQAVPAGFDDTCQGEEEEWNGFSDVDALQEDATITNGESAASIVETKEKKRKKRHR